ncbi:MAG: hypothetical protein ACOYI9_13915 [Candidatus Hydrogenedentales bacterium]
MSYRGLRGADAPLHPRLLMVSPLRGFLDTLYVVLPSGCRMFSVPVEAGAYNTRRVWDSVWQNRVGEMAMNPSGEQETCGIAGGAV